MKRIPALPTLVVLLAVAVMIRLGFWQLDRLHQKEAMLARYAAASTMSSEAPWPGNAAERETALFRHSHLGCGKVTGMSAISGRSAAGAAGWAHVASCLTGGGGQAEVVLGWSRDPAPSRWDGGEVSGIVAPSGRVGARLVAGAPLAGLEASAPPDPRDVPNNHLSYAAQWFLFAATAMVIYALALRKRLAAGGARG